MKWAKPHVDVGLMARDAEAMLAFYQQEVGLALAHVLPTGRGNHQRRHDMNGSVLKLNVARDGAPEASPTGYRRLHIVRPGLAAPVEHTDPDGNAVRLVPAGWDGIEGVAIELGVRDVAAHARFYEEAIGLDGLGDGRFRCGDSLFLIEGDAGAPTDAGVVGAGFRYTTIQVFDCDAATERALAAGAGLGAPARTMGDVARFSMVRDPDGNWVELSQRKSLTGPLPADRDSV